MKAVDAARVGIRLLALYFAVHSLQAWGQLLALLTPDIPWDEMGRSSVAIASSIPGAVQGLLAVVLWLLAGRLAAAVAGKSGAAVGEDGPRAAWESAALAVGGAVVAATAIPGAMSTLYMLQQPAVHGFSFTVYQLAEYRAALIGDALQLIIGAGMLAGAARIAPLLRRLRGDSVHTRS